MLCHTSLRSFEEDQERAIIKILEPIRSQRDYREVLEHMTVDGGKIPVQEAEALLYGVLDGDEAARFEELRRARAFFDRLVPDVSPANLAVAELKNNFGMA